MREPRSAPLRGFACRAGSAGRKAIGRENVTQKRAVLSTQNHRPRRQLSGAQPVRRREDAPRSAARTPAGRGLRLKTACAPEYAASWYPFT